MLKLRMLVTKMLGVIFCVVSISISVVGLHYSEAIENDGLTLCEVVDVSSGTCHDRQKSDSDNDNETVHVLYEIDSTKKIELISPMALPHLIRLPDYINSYFFGFIIQLLKPPIRLS